MSVTAKVMRNDGVEIPTYVSMDDKETILAIAVPSRGEVHFYKPVLSMEHPRKRQKLIDDVMAKAKRKYGVKSIVERPDSTVQVVDGTVRIYTPQPDVLGASV
ncbi:hypothetical protein pVa21_101 [Vibrio phage pVa-21]|nr:hypothetical protein pVa21_101 [Vibrio phage pVa-21]